MELLTVDLGDLGVKFMKIGKVQNIECDQGLDGEE